MHWNYLTLLIVVIIASLQANLIDLPLDRMENSKVLRVDKAGKLIPYYSLANLEEELQASRISHMQKHQAVQAAMATATENYEPTFKITRNKEVVYYNIAQKGVVHPTDSTKMFDLPPDDASAINQQVPASTRNMQRPTGGPIQKSKEINSNLVKGKRKLDLIRRLNMLLHGRAKLGNRRSMAHILRKRLRPRNPELVMHSFDKICKDDTTHSVFGVKKNRQPFFEIDEQKRGRILKSENRK